MTATIKKLSEKCDLVVISDGIDYKILTYQSSGVNYYYYIKDNKVYGLSVDNTHNVKFMIDSSTLDDFSRVNRDKTIAMIFNKNKKWSYVKKNLGTIPFQTIILNFIVNSILSSIFKSINILDYLNESFDLKNKIDAGVDPLKENIYDTIGRLPIFVQKTG